MTLWESHRSVGGSQRKMVGFEDSPHPSIFILSIRVHPWMPHPHPHIFSPSPSASSAFQPPHPYTGSRSSSPCTSSISVFIIAGPKSKVSPAAAKRSGSGREPPRARALV